MTDSDAAPFVPDDFEVPAVLETEQFRLRMLSTSDVERDYDALMSSAPRLREMFGRDWPTEDFTLAENLEDLAEHEEEFLRREAFTYTVMSLDESECLGCLYINPPRDYPCDARVYLWVRDSAYEQGLDPVLFQTVRRWLADSWPFDNPLFPGRHDDGSWFPLEGRLV